MKLSSSSGELLPRTYVGAERGARSQQPGARQPEQLLCCPPTHRVCRAVEQNGLVRDDPAG
jgi:hypothetical protein